MTLTKYTAEQAKQNLEKLTYEEIRQLLINQNEPSDDYSTNHFYLGHLCSRGDIAEAERFLQSLEYGLEIVNKPYKNYNDGTILHIILYWNSGEVGRQLFELLNSYGAEYYENEKGVLPWEQEKMLEWKDPISNVVFGIRNESEFDSLYIYIRNTYGADISLPLG